MRRRLPALSVHLAAACSCVSIAGIACGQDAASVAPDDYTFHVASAAQPPVIDGVLDDAVWNDAELIDNFTQVDPDEGAAPTLRTEMRLLRDADGLYIAIRCYHDDPSSIVATTMLRDAGLDSDDRVTIVIDTFLDRRNGYQFEMNAIGAKRDALIENNGRPRDDWDGIWEGKSRIDDTGWTVEMAIPVKTVGFAPGGDQWGFNVGRVIRATNESVQWASPTRNTPVRAPASAGVISGLEAFDKGIGLDVRPFGVASLKQNDNGDGFDIDGGVDLFYRVTPGLTAALTFNTDFAETEVDERRVNLTRFPLFFPEKRAFFLQDAGIFSFGGVRFSPLAFHSRRIGIGPDGEQRDILVGGKLTGRVGDVNIGLLNVQMRDDPVLGSKNFTVARAKVNVLDESSVGAIFTAGDPGSAGDSHLAGVDFLYRNSKFNGDRVLDGAAYIMHSDSTGAGDDNLSFGARIGYPNDRVRWSAGFSQIGADFDAALGFISRRAIREYFGDWRYRWRPGGGIRAIDASVRVQLTTNLDDVIESHEVNAEWFAMELDSSDRLTLRSQFQREQLFNPFDISSGVTIPAGDYHFAQHEVEFRSSSARPISVGTEVRFGDFYDGTRWDAGADIQWRASPNLFIGAEFEQNNVDLPGGSFITRIVRGRLNVFFTPDVSWTNFVQYDNVSQSMGVNSRLRWIVKPGSEMFIVLNQAFEVATDRFTPESTELTTKVGWTFRF